ncbi:unnamed protein product [Spirodela intermedia]|uniref:CRM domain-containing protein n=1 Tax=Spirodela intermedia TaxID=51605 RepID=A0A7I8IKE6_SPIIN|nr:unnamed protein product [Spirodela intermedia]CAA6658233.1 unnamed protein product [Spirodela intermedia]
MPLFKSPHRRRGIGFLLLPPPRSAACGCSGRRRRRRATPILTLPSRGYRRRRFPVHSDLPFDFRYSYSETDCSSLDRTWNQRVGDRSSSALALRIGGVTHNLLDDIHNHWKRAEAVRIKCLGAPTLDMDNVCFHIEVPGSRQNGGKIIYRRINILLLYRGRNYDPRRRPVVPLMLWKPRAPIYPRLVKNAAEGLTFEETKEMRSRGLNSPVREAFKTEEVVRLNCSSVETSDSKKIGVKLRDLVPCVPILFKKGQIVIWRGRQTQSSVDHQEPQDQA